MIPVPVLTPWLSSHWIAFFSGVDSAVGRKLIEGLKNPTLVENNKAHDLFDIRPVSASEAMGQALEKKPACETENMQNESPIDLLTINQDRRKHVHTV
jgi:hypothetical protein